MFDGNLEVVKGTWNGANSTGWSEYWKCNTFIPIKSSCNYSATFKYDGVLKPAQRFYYDKDKKYISYSATITNKAPDNAKFIRLSGICVSSGVADLSKVSNIQLEEGTQGTPYEPYQEDKLTILSPTPLEKVGNIADRIICKDGVYGVEKNIITKVLDSSYNWFSGITASGFKFFASAKVFSNGVSSRVVLCDKLVVKSGTQDTIDGYGQLIPHRNPNYSSTVYLSTDIEEISLFLNWLDESNIKIKYATETQPQFIPLPHDQQIKLRTFADKTHISFDTEIEPTIKAQVPKSLGATVNTHTTQIDNLNKELDRVKK